MQLHSRSISGTSRYSSVKTPHASSSNGRFTPSTLNNEIEESDSDDNVPVPEKKVPAKLDPPGFVPTSAARVSLKGLGREIQEALIVEDLLYVILGIPGQYITARESTTKIKGMSFQTDPNLEPSLASAVARFLPLATYYTGVSAFIDSYSGKTAGVVSQALCEALRDILRQYTDLIAHIESLYLSCSAFTLRLFQSYIHEALYTMHQVHALTVDIAALDAPEDSDSDSDSDDELKDFLNGMRAPQTSAKGGYLVSFLYDRYTSLSGDPVAQKLHQTLLLKASQPYLRILLQWIAQGRLSDPYGEFFVRENASTALASATDYTDDFWERRYTLHSEESVPAFLRPYKTKVLLAGKYVNVVRECDGKGSARPGAPQSLLDLPLDALLDRLVEHIENAYLDANKTLLNLLLDQYDLRQHLTAIKQSFFIDHGDSFVTFLDLARQELQKKKKHASVVKLQSLLDLAYRNDDSIRDDLRIELANSPLIDWLISVVNITGADDEAKKPPRNPRDQERQTAQDFLTLDYSVKFPLSLVISRKTILRYQLIFRYLLQLKLTERALEDKWTDHMKLQRWRKSSPHPDVEMWKRRVFSLRARMLFFIQQLYSFAVSEVLEPNWKALLARLQPDRVETVDELLNDHVDFLDTCLKECLLTNEKLLEMHERLIHVCAIFTSYTNKLNHAIKTLNDTADSNPGKDMSEPLKANWELLDKFEKNYNHHSRIHLEKINFYSTRENSALQPLVVRLTNLKLPPTAVGFD